MNVPSQEEFDALKAQVDRLTATLNLLLEQMPTMLTIEQTATALNCSRRTVHRLTCRGDLLPMRYEGKKPLYHVCDIRMYIISTCVSEETADQRLLIARTAGK